MDVAEVEANHKVHPSPLDGEDKGLKRVEDVGCHWSVHQGALQFTLTGQLETERRTAMVTQVDPATAEDQIRSGTQYTTV